MDGNTPKPLRAVSAATLASRPAPAQPWHVRDWIPGRNVTLLTGDGAAGKSLLMLQAAVATVLGDDWIGLQARTGPVVFVSAEDELDEVHRRLERIAGARLAELGALHIVPLAGRDAILASPRDGILAPTPLMAAIDGLVAETGATLVIVDTLADTFAGGENDRAHARQFVGMLRGLALRRDAAVVLIAHPSLSGLASGAGTSGSTAWSNSVRSRLYLRQPITDKDGPADRDARILERLKANYAATGETIELRWRDGLMMRADVVGMAVEDRAKDAQAIFLQCLRRLESEGRSVSAKKSPTYAPAVFHKQPEAKGLRKVELEDAMTALFAAGRLRVETTGFPSRPRSQLVECAPSDRTSNRTEKGFQPTSDRLPTVCLHTPPITPDRLEAPVGNRAPTGAVGNGEAAA